MPSYPAVPGYAHYQVYLVQTITAMQTSAMILEYKQLPIEYHTETVKLPLTPGIFC